MKGVLQEHVCNPSKFSDKKNNFSDEPLSFHRSCYGWLAINWYNDPLIHLDIINHLAALSKVPWQQGCRMRCCCRLQLVEVSISDSHGTKKLALCVQWKTEQTHWSLQITILGKSCMSGYILNHKKGMFEYDMFVVFYECWNRYTWFYHMVWYRATWSSLKKLKKWKFF